MEDEQSSMVEVILVQPNVQYWNESEEIKNKVTFFLPILCFFDEIHISAIFSISSLKIWIILLPSPFPLQLHMG